MAKLSEKNRQPVETYFNVHDILMEARAAYPEYNIATACYQHAVMQQNISKFSNDEANRLEARMKLLLLNLFLTINPN